MNYKYGNKIIIKKGLFDGCKGIIMNRLENGFYCLEVFFKVGKEHFLDKNKESVSTLIKMNKSEFEKYKMGEKIVY